MFKRSIARREIGGRYLIQDITPIQYGKWGLLSLFMGCLVGTLVSMPIYLVYLPIAAIMGWPRTSFLNEEWICENLGFLALYYGFFIGAYGAYTGAHGHEENIYVDRLKRRVDGDTR